MVYQRLMEIESRLLPMGLHTVGVPPTAEEAIATLVSIAEIDRPEDDILGLPRILANAKGRKLEEIYRTANEGILGDVELLQQITEATRAAVRAMVQESTDSTGRVKEVTPMAKLMGSMMGAAPYRTALEKTGFASAAGDAALTPLFEYLEFCLRQVVADNELGAFPWALAHLPALEEAYRLIDESHNDVADIEKGAAESTVVVGHSSGAVAAMRLAERCKLRGIVVVAGYDSDLGDANERASGYFDRPFDWDAIRANCGFVCAVGGARDDLVDIAIQRRVAMECLGLQAGTPGLELSLIHI